MVAIGRLRVGGHGERERRMNFCVRAIVKVIHVEISSNLQCIFLSGINVLYDALLQQLLEI